MQIGYMRSTIAAAASARCRIDPRGGPPATPRRDRPGCGADCRRQGAAPPAPRALAQGLEALLAAGPPPPASARITAAARAFAEGNGLFTGQRVNRRA